MGMPVGMPKGMPMGMGMGMPIGMHMGMPMGMPVGTPGKLLSSKLPLKELLKELKECLNERKECLKEPNQELKECPNALKDRLKELCLRWAQCSVYRTYIYMYTICYYMIMCFYHHIRSCLHGSIVFMIILLHYYIVMLPCDYNITYYYMNTLLEHCMVIWLSYSLVVLSY